MAIGATIIWLDKDRRCPVRSPNDSSRIGLDELLIGETPSRVFQIVPMERNHLGQYGPSDLVGASSINVGRWKPEPVGTFRLTYNGIQSKTIFVEDTPSHVEKLLNEVSSVRSFGGFNVFAGQAGGGWLLQAKTDGAASALIATSVALAVGSGVEVVTISAGSASARALFAINLQQTSLAYQAASTPGSFSWGEPGSSEVFPYREFTVSLNTIPMAAALGSATEIRGLFQLESSGDGFLLHEPIRIVQKIGVPITPLPIFGQGNLTPTEPTGTPDPIGSAYDWYFSPNYLYIKHPTAGWKRTIMMSF